MIAAVSLLGYAAAMATVGPWLLNRTRWTLRSPRLGILAWFALVSSVLVAVLMASVVAWLPRWPGTMGLADLLNTCAMLLQQQYRTPAGAVTGTVGLLLALAVVARLLLCGMRIGVTTRRARRAQRHLISMVGPVSGPHPGYHVVHHQEPAAYCIPGRHPEIVLTSATLSSLDGPQLRAVLAHEREHLRGHHHLLVALAEAARDAFPFVPAFVAAFEEITRLVEMRADQRAVEATDELTLASALLRLAQGRTPIGSLAAGGSALVARVGRLTEPMQPLTLAHGVAVHVAALMLAVVPVLIAAAPALAVVSAPYCPVW